MTEHQSTHALGCWDCGPKHYECAVGEIERLRTEIERLRSEIESLRRQPLPAEAIADLWSQAIVQAATAECNEVVEFARAIERAHGIEGDAC